MSKENRSSYAKKNIFYGYLNKICTIILEFLVRTIFIKILGEELLGVNGVFTNVLQILSIVELGINNVVSYSFYEPLAKKDEKKIDQLIKFYKQIYNRIAIIILLFGLFLIPFLKDLIKMNFQISNLKLIYFIFLLDTVFSYLFVYKGILLNADQKGYIVTKYRTLFILIRASFQILALTVFKSFIGYLIIKVITTILVNLKISMVAEKEYRYINGSSNNNISKKEKKKIQEIIKSGFIYKISGVLLNGTDNILISILVGTIWVGYLSNYIMILTALSTVYTILFSSVTSSIGNLIFTENIKKRNDIFELMIFISSWLANVLSICFLALSNEFIYLWLGENYILDKHVVLAQAIILVISCSSQPLFCFREALGLYQKTKYVMLFAATINILLSIILGKVFGISGILYATIISMLSTYVWYEPVLLYKEYLKKSYFEYFKIKFYDIFLIFIGFIIILFFNNHFKVSSWLEWLLKGSILFLSVNMYCFIFYRKKTEFRTLLEKLKIVYKGEIF